MNKKRNRVPRPAAATKVNADVLLRLRDIVHKRLAKNPHPKEKTVAAWCDQIAREFGSNYDWLVIEYVALAGSVGTQRATNDVTLFIERLYMKQGDSYSAGQAGAMGPQAHAQNMTFIWNQGQFNVVDLAADLSKLRSAMKAVATTPEHDAAVGAVASAETAAKKGDGPKALEFLKGAGQWALDAATQIGAGVAAAAITKAMEGK